MEDIEKHKNWLKVLSLADESLRRKLAAAKALDLGWGGISTVARISGMSIWRIWDKQKEFENQVVVERRLRSKIPKLWKILRRLWTRIPEATQ